MYLLTDIHRRGPHGFDLGATGVSDIAPQRCVGLGALARLLLAQPVQAKSNFKC